MIAAQTLKAMIMTTTLTGTTIILRPIGKALVDGQISRNHSAHHMVFLQIDEGLRFERRVEISAQLCHVPCHDT